MTPSKQLYLGRFAQKLADELLRTAWEMDPNSEECVSVLCVSKSLGNLASELRGYDLKETKPTGNYPDYKPGGVKELVPA